jgi:hypothetical protein
MMIGLIFRFKLIDDPGMTYGKLNCKKITFLQYQTACLLYFILNWKQAVRYATGELPVCF